MPDVEHDAPFILTLDIGTSSVRASVYDVTGQSLPETVAAAPQDVYATGDGRAEMQPDVVVQKCLDVLEKSVERLGPGRRHHLAGVGVCTLWHTLMGVDEAGTPSTPLILWSDTRSSQQVAALQVELDEPKFHSRTGCPFHTSYLPAKLLWLRENDQTAYERTQRWMSIGEYLFLKLFGRSAMSWSMASGTGLLDVETLEWHDDLLAHLQLSPENFSRLENADLPVTGLLAPYRGLLPDLANVPWLPAIGDGASSNLGSGCGSPSRIALMVGTSGAMRAVQTGARAPIPQGGWCYRVDAQRYVFGGSLSSGGNIYDWMRRTLALPDPDQIEEELRAMPADGHGLTFLPFLSGERSPGWNPNATGILVGMRLHTKPIDIVRAGLEAIAYRFARIHRSLQPLVPDAKEIIATGGGLLRSPAWMQIIADVLGQPLRASEEKEASSRGVALFTLEKLGLLQSLADAPSPTGKTYEPDAARHGRYEQAIDRQEALYQRMLVNP